MSKTRQKKSSRDTSATLGRNLSPDSTTKGTGTVINEFGYFQERLEKLNQLYGDIKNIYTELDQSTYTLAQRRYEALHDEIKKDLTMLPQEKKQLLFKIYEYQAISDFRAGIGTLKEESATPKKASILGRIFKLSEYKPEFEKHNEHLLHAYDNYGPDIDKSIIGLERWVEIYKKLGANAEKVPSVSPRYDSLLTKVETEVQSLIKDGKYEQANKRMKYLNENSHNFQIFGLYASTMEDKVEAFGYLKGKTDGLRHETIHKIFKGYENYFKSVKDTKHADEAATYAAEYNPNPDTASATPPVNPKVRKAEKACEKSKEQFEKDSIRLEELKTLDAQDKQIQELEAQYKLQYTGALEEVKAFYNAKLETLKASPTKDTKMDGAGYSSTPSAPPPSYNDAVNIANHPFLKIRDQNASPAPTPKPVTPLAPEVLDELTKLAKSIASSNYYDIISEGIPLIKYRDVKCQSAKDKAKKLLTDAITNEPKVYETIENPEILLLVADTLLSSKKIDLARVVCKKALDLNPNIWKDTCDPIVLINLAGVLLSSNQPIAQSTAKEIYERVILRTFHEDDRGYCKIAEDRTTIASKTIAQDGYSNEERDCLAKVCLSSPKAYQKAQALNCYTDVAKRLEIAGQLKQFAKTMPDSYEGWNKCYTLYSKVSFVLKDDQALFQDMKAAYGYTSLRTAPVLFPYPPTEESTTYLIGDCASNDC